MTRAPQITQAAAKLATKALGVLDVVSPDTLHRIREGRTKGARVTVSPQALRELLDAVDEALPGTVDAYVAERTRAARKAAR